MPEVGRPDLPRNATIFMLTILLHALSIPSAAVSDTRLTESFVYGCLQPYMPTYSVRASGDLAEEIEAFADAYEGSRSDALRELLRRGIEADRLRRERDSLQNQLNTLAGREREHGELVEYVQEERSLQQRREERRERERQRERERENAPAWRRAKWWLFGRSTS